jgi:hypothetical protein
MMRQRAPHVIDGSHIPIAFLLHMQDLIIVTGPRRRSLRPPASPALGVVWTSLGPLPRWVPGPTTRWAPGTTQLVPHGT